ncbi:MAG: hypothetical protein WDO15_14100 [Bacteroidota bacterium]
MDDDLLKDLNVSMENFSYSQTTFTLKGRPYTDKIDHLINVKIGGVIDPFEEIRVDVP